MTQQCRRPEPRSCEDIGTWYIILEVHTALCLVLLSVARACGVDLKLYTLSALMLTCVYGGGCYFMRCALARSTELLGLG
jgi:hypothetical protein